MLQTIVVVCIVAVAVFLVGRSLHRTLTGKEADGGCTGNCAKCPARRQGGRAKGDDG